MATLTVYSSLDDGEVRSNSNVYATMQAGTGTLVLNSSGTTVMAIGQEVFAGQYYGYQGFLDFDTSTLGASASVSSAVLDLYATSRAVAGSSAFDVEVRIYDWGTTLATGDWVAASTLGNQTLVCKKAETSMSTQNQYYSFDDIAFAANVNKTAETRVVVNSSRLRIGNVPTSTEYQRFSTANASGTTQDPKLVVTYTTYTPQDPLGRMGFFGI